MLQFKFLLIVFLCATVADVTAKVKKPIFKKIKFKKPQKAIRAPKEPKKGEPKVEPAKSNILEPYGVEVDSTHALLIDYQSGKILLQKNANEQLEPASMTKIMTAYMVMKAMHEGRVKPESMVTISRNARKIEKGSSDMFLEVGDQVTIEELLKGLIIVSGNDAAVALAEYLGGTQSAFSADMTHVARELGCKQTNFKNASGLPEEGHLTSAYDLFLMSKKMFEEFPKWYGIHKEIDFTYRGIHQQNRNLLLTKNIGCDGIKTGHTERAGYGMVASAVQNGRRLFLVVCGLKSAKQRGEESYRLLQWGFGTFGNYTIVPKNQPIMSLPVRYGSVESIEVEPKSHVLTLHRNRISQVKAVVKHADVLVAPIKAGDQVGEVIVTHPDFANPVVIPLVVNKDVTRSIFLSRMGQTLRYLFEKG